MSDKDKSGRKVPNSTNYFPKFRFPEFSEDWETLKLNEFATINPKSDELPREFIYIDLESVVNGILIKENKIRRIDAPSRAQRFLQNNDVLFQTVRPYQKNNYFFNRKGFYVASTGYAHLRTTQNSAFLFQFLHNQNFVDKVIEKCTGTSYPAINSTDLGKIKIHFPTIKEQNKIARFLGLFDARIQTQKKTINQLNSQIEILVNLFMEEKLKLKGSYEKWKTFKLAEIGETFNGLTGKSKEDFGSGKRYIQYKQIFDSRTIDINECGFVEIDENENQSKVKFGDAFFTVSSETANEIGMSSVLLQEVDDTYMNSFCFGFRTFSHTALNPKFASFLFRSKVFRNTIVKLAQGSTRYNMSKNEFLKLKINLPTESEQIKISNILASLSEKLETEKRILALLEQQKKYFLQNLFI